jgi:hypothetical protein
MVKVEHIETYGWEAAIRGMRNPMNSWDKSDSYISEDGSVVVGPADFELMKRLVRGGTEHRKFLRQIFISMDITAPLYWWKEFDTYKIGTTADSCSTMHKIHAKEFTIFDFSCEKLGWDDLSSFTAWLELLNRRREKYLESKDKTVWYQMIQMLPSSYNQKRTITMNYEVAMNICRQRENHKLDEWRDFVNILLVKLPHLEEFRDCAQ